MPSRIRNYLQSDGLGPLLLKAVTGSAGLRIAGMGFGFLVGVLLARGLGAEGYGVYGVAMSIIALLTVPTEFGLPQLLTREVATAHLHRDWGRLRGILQWSVRTSMGISVVIIVFVIAWVTLSGEGIGSPLGKTMFVGLGLVPLVALLSLRSAALRAMQRIVSGQLPDVVLRPGGHALVLLAVSLLAVPLTPVMAMGFGVIAAALALVAAEIMLHRAVPPEVRGVPPVINGRAWWSSALPMAMTEGMRLLQAHLLILVLGWLIPMAEVGLFRMATSVVLVLSMPVSLLNIVCMPIVARLFAGNDRARLQQLLPLVALGMTAGVTVLTLPFLIGGEELLAWLFGDQFAAGNRILLVLSLTAVANSVFGLAAILLTMTGHQVQVTKASFASLLILLLVSWPLIAYFGAMGAAFANLIAIVAWNFALWISAKRNLQLDTSIFQLMARMQMVLPKG